MRLLALILAFSVPASVLAQSPNGLRVVAYSGEHAPDYSTFGHSYDTSLGTDSDAGAVFPVFIDNSGNVLFGDGQGTYVESSPGAIVRLSPLSNTYPGNEYNDWHATFNSSGTIAAEFYNQSNDGNPLQWVSVTQNTSGASGWVQVAVTDGTQFGQSGAATPRFDPTINGAGAIAFGGADPITNYDGVYVIRNPATLGSISTVETGGTSAPGPGGQTFASMSNTQHSFYVPINSSANVAFQSTITNTSSGITGSGIYKEVSGSHTLTNVAYGSNAGGAAMSAPGVQYNSMGLHSTTATFGTFNNSINSATTGIANPAFNDAGQVAFQASLNTGGNITSSNNQGIWTDAPGSLTIVAQTGTTAVPSTAAMSYSPPAGSTFTSLDPPVINGNGRIAFTASVNLNPGTGTGIFTRSPDSGSPTLNTVAISGQTAFSGYTYNQINRPSFGLGDSPLAMNGAGQSMVFGAILTDSSLGTHSAIMTVDPYGNVEPAVLSGVDSIMGSSISSVSFGWLGSSGGQDSIGNQLNANGQFVYNAILANSTVIVATGKIVLGGDANGDGRVDIQDLSLIATNWLKPEPIGTNGDVNYDGIVNIQDYTYAANNWLHTLVPAAGYTVAPVPEPGTLSLAAFAGIGLILVRCRWWP